MAIELLKYSNEMYGILPVGTITRIQKVIEELEDILGEKDKNSGLLDLIDPRD